MRARAAGSLATSVLLHVAVLAGGAWLLSRSLRSESAPAHGEHLVEIGVEEHGTARAIAAAGTTPGQDLPALESEPPEVQRSGGEIVPRPDTLQRGSGGRATSVPALNLASSIDRVTLEREIINAFHRGQVQRLRTAAERASYDDRRATPEPMQMTFVVSGKGTRPERRSVALVDPARGSHTNHLPRTVGGTLGGPVQADGYVQTLPVGVARFGSVSEAAGAGVVDGDLRYDARQSAAVSMARPWVPPASPAVPSETRGRPSDTVDSPQEVASTQRARIAASTVGGAAGNDRGGERGDGVTGFGRSDAFGSQSEAGGFGPGPRRSAGDDPRLTNYFRSMMSRVEPLWQNAFPDWAIAEGRGGVAIVGVTVHADGSVSALRVVRGSGVSEFDRNVMDAVARAAPFGPLPKSLGSSVRINMSFDALNPAVGRIGPGPGRAVRR